MSTVNPSSDGFVSTVEELEVEGTTDSTTGLSSRLRTIAGATKEKATEWRDGLQTGIRANPIRSVLIAAGIGAAIGILGGVLASRRAR